MRVILFFLLLPAWAAAQPVEIAPEQVIGFARADLNENGIDERYLLVLDSEGGVDLYIFHGITGAPTVYIENFIETTRNPPAIMALGTSSIDISLHSTDGLGSHDRRWMIGWDWEIGGYAVVGLRLETIPRMADEPGFSCGIDFLVGGVRTVTGDGHAVVREISVLPSPLLAPVPEANFSLCYN